MARLRSLLAGLAAAAMAGTLLSGPAAAATGSATPQPLPNPSGAGASGPASSNATFGIQPATAKGPDSRDGFTYEATPGAMKVDYVAITNYTTQQVSLHVYATDAYNAQDGGFTVLPSTTKPRDIGLWIELPRQFLTIPGKTTVVMPFTLRVPANASVGDHAGGIMAALTTMAYDAKGNQVAIESRVGSRVALRVPGKLSGAVTVTAVSVSYHDPLNPFGAGSATVSYTVNNTGNVRLSGTQSVRVSSLVGGSKDSEPVANIKELLPGDSVRVTTRVNGVLPSLTGTVRITVGPAAFTGDADPKMSSVSQTTTMIAMPWSFLVLLVLLAALAYLYRRHRRQTRSTATRTKPTPKPTAPPAPKSTTGPRTTAPRPKPKVTVTAPVPTKAGAKSVRP
ncbi:MAG TPA: DUF916 domain-containing protein [Actinocrinis sp.]|nr:DUF916 domain-containing protein [Actinocrinis sp.]